MSWMFLPDPYDQGEALGYHGANFDFSGWVEVELPCAFADALPELHGYEGIGWFILNRYFPFPFFSCGLDALMRARNCFGRADRDSGQRRVPWPPARMTGTIGSAT